MITILISALVLSCFSGCLILDFGTPTTDAEESLSILVYKTQNENGEIGYRREIELCLAESTLLLYKNEYADVFSAAEANLMLNGFFSPDDPEEYQYSSTQETVTSGQTRYNLYIYDFSSFESLGTDEDKYLSYEMTDSNIFREKYTFTMDNLYEGIPEPIKEKLEGFKSFFPSGTINNLPLNYYLYCGASHVTNNGEGTRTLYSEDGSSVTFAYWKASWNETPTFIYYRVLPVTLGWNIIAIAVGVVVMSILFGVFYLRRDKDREDINDDKNND